MAVGLFFTIYSLVLFFSALLVIGKISLKLGIPSVVGEIVTGIILGPYFLDLVPHYEALMIIGDIGLLLLMLEAGIDVNMGVLKVVGTRGLLIAIFGSLVPSLMGCGIAYAMNPDINIRVAIAIGACFAPTSLAIALGVLRSAKLLNTPTGQLIIAAGVLDDVIGLMLLSVLKELSKDPISYIDLSIAVLGAPILMLIFGVIAIYLAPCAIKLVMDRIHIKHHEYAILFMLFATMIILIPCCHYARSSYLLGAFLAGLLFCTDHTVHHVWEKQTQKIMHWLLRIFFACTIGFEVPIRDLINPNILLSGLIYFTAIFGKITTGFFALMKPLKCTEFFTIGFSMSAWGEFAFILASNAYNEGIFGHDTYSEILLAVLLSVIISPLLLKITLKAERKKKYGLIKQTRKNTTTIETATLFSPSRGFKRKQLNFSMANDESSDGSTLFSDSVAVYKHCVYYRIQTKTYGKWGHQDRLLRSLYSVKLKLIDFRVFNELTEDNTTSVEDIFFVKDTQLSLLPTTLLDGASQRDLLKRVYFIKRGIKDALQDKRAKINIMRWLPGIKKAEDLSEEMSGERHRRFAVSSPYVRDAAYKQARFALSSHHLRPWNNIHPIDEENENQQPGTLKRSRLNHNHVSDSDTDLSSRGNVHCEKYDDLVKLNLAESKMDIWDDNHEMSSDANSICLDVLYGDQDVNGQPLIHARCPKKSVTTPLLKK